MKSALKKREIYNRSETMMVVSNAVILF